MIQEGQVVLFTFPQTSQVPGKIRPALAVRRLPGPHDGWLRCMVSSQLRQEVPGVDEILRDSDPDFGETGLKRSSVIRITRLAVVAADILHGTIGTLSEERLTRIRIKLSDWIRGNCKSPDTASRD